VVEVGGISVGAISLQSFTFKLHGRARELTGVVVERSCDRP